MIIDELNKKIADIESLANDKSSTIESKVSDLTDGLLMVADAVDIIPEMVDEKITAITKEFSIIKDSVSKVKAQKGDNGRDGIDGIDGVDGLDGKDGSPDKPKDIADKLNTLENVIDPKVIKGSSEYINRTDLNKTISTLENQTRFLIQSNANKSTGSGGGTWGSITGTLSAQTDLQSALDNKLGTVTTDGTLTGAGTEDSPLSVVATSASDVAVTVRAATTAALAGTWTYDNGTSGVGATLTRTTNGVLPNQDGISLSDGDRFLIKNQASTLANGVYVLTQKGVASVSPTIFTRATDADETSELDELVVTVSEGSTNRGTVWGQQTNNPVVGTSAIVFATVVSTAVTQATSGTQAINQIPLYTGTARQLTRGTANFKYNPTTDLFTIRGIDYTFPANNGDASQVLTTDGSGILSWAAPTSSITADATYNNLFSSTLGSGAALSGATGGINNIMLNYQAGQNVTTGNNNNFLGYQAGKGPTTGVTNANFLGYQSGLNATSATNSNFLGRQAGSGATSASFANFFGRSAGLDATSAQYGVFIGDNAGNTASGSSNAVFIGQNAGYQATTAPYSIFIGTSAGYKATGATTATFIGYAAGYTASDAYYANFIGRGAGNAATNASYSNFSGYQAGYGATNAKNSIFIGQNAGFNDTVDNTASGSSIAIGDSAGTGGFQNSIALGGSAVNTKTNQFMIGSSIDTIVLPVAKTPSSASDTGTTGTICWDASYIYVCTATDTWKRSAIATW